MLFCIYHAIAKSVYCVWVHTFQTRNAFSQHAAATSIQPPFNMCNAFQASQAAPLPPLKEGEALQVKIVELVPGKTSVSIFPSAATQ